MAKTLTLKQFSWLLLAKLAENASIIDLNNRERRICSLPTNYKQIIQDILTANETWKEWFSCLIDTESYFDNPYVWEAKLADTLNETLKRLNKKYSYNFENDTIDIDFTQEEIYYILSCFSKNVLKQMEHFASLMASYGSERKKDEYIFMSNKIKDSIRNGQYDYK